VRSSTFKKKKPSWGELGFRGGGEATVFGGKTLWPLLSL